MGWEVTRRSPGIWDVKIRGFSTGKFWPVTSKGREQFLTERRQRPTSRDPFRDLFFPEIAFSSPYQVQL